MPPALEARSLDHWTAREVPRVCFDRTVVGQRPLPCHQQMGSSELCQACSVHDTVGLDQGDKCGLLVFSFPAHEVKCNRFLVQNASS